MRVLLWAALALLTACQSVTPLPPLPAWQGREGLQHADLGLIRDLRSGATLTPAQLLEQFEATFVGEHGRRHSPKSSTFLDGVKGFWDRMVS